jgi:ribonuclease HII
MVKRICGIDEAGRGPLAGPLFAAAVVAPEDFELRAVDSKKLSQRQREAWLAEFEVLASVAGLAYRVEQISVAEINAHGIGWANREIFRRLILALEADEYWVDGRRNKLAGLGEKAERTRYEIKGDERLAIIAAASILAKTHRDRVMIELHQNYPHYRWDENKGYGTAAHISAIKTFGRTPHHRGMYATTVEGREYQREGRAVGKPLLLLGPGPLLLLLTLLQGLQVFQHSVQFWG